MKPFSKEGNQREDFVSEGAWLVILGPTAVGKSALAEHLAQQLRTDIVTADSRQIYKGMEVGTGKPGKEARLRVARHLIDLISPEQSFSVGAYKKEAESVIAEIERKGEVVLIEGGTGLYIKALLDGLWEGPPADWILRKRLKQQEDDEGEGSLHRFLSGVDSEAAQKIHPRDLPKIIRALEVYTLCGRPLSEVHAAHRISGRMRHKSRLIGLNRDRADLYRRIELRVESYITSGLVEEVARLLDCGLHPEQQSMRALGYRQIVPAIMGERSLDESVDILKRDTRRFAKRQLTWFKAQADVEWIHIEPGETSAQMIEGIKQSDRL
jgi:tRNA dimethylallyltransferase